MELKLKIFFQTQIFFKISCLETRSAKEKFFTSQMRKKRHFFSYETRLFVQVTIPFSHVLEML